MKKNILAHYVLLLLGTAILAFGLYNVHTQSAITEGGVLGTTLLLRHHFGISPAVSEFCIDAICYLIGWRLLGKTFLQSSIVATLSFSAFYSLFAHVGYLLPDLSASPVLAALLGALFVGVGVGLVLRMGSCGGGMDIVGMIMTQWKRDFSVGKVNLVVNLALYGTCLFLFDVEIVVYSIIYAAAYSLAMDKVHIQNINVEATIITKTDTKELEKAIFDDLYRGITKWNAMGAYTHDESHILYVLLSKYEVSRFKTLVRKYDPNAFSVLNEGVSVQGNFLKKL